MRTRTALQILNAVEPNGELLSTDQAIEAMEAYLIEFVRWHNVHGDSYIPDLEIIKFKKQNDNQRS